MACLDAAMKKHLPEWRRISLSLLRNQVNADDLVSEVLLKLLENQPQKAEQLACEGKLYSYVNRAIYTMCFDTSSRYGVLYLSYSQNWCSDSTQHEREPEPTWLGARMINESLDGIISRMRPHERALIRLYALPDFDYQKLSDETGIEKKQLYKLLENSINKLKRYVHRSTPSGSAEDEDMPLV